MNAVKKAVGRGLSTLFFIQGCKELIKGPTGKALASDPACAESPCTCTLRDVRRDRERAMDNEEEVRKGVFSAMKATGLPSNPHDGRLR